MREDKGGGGIYEGRDGDGGRLDQEGMGNV